VRLVVARCSVDYAGRLSAHLPLATRLLTVKADSSVLVHSDGGSLPSDSLKWRGQMRTGDPHGRTGSQSLRPHDVGASGYRASPPRLA
jgi:Endonuclease NucS